MSSHGQYAGAATGQRLAGRRAVVTGSSAGIGFAIAQRLALEGAQVVVNSRDHGRAADSAARIGELIGDRDRVTGRAADVADPVSAAGLVDWAAGHMGGLDILVNNAGMTMTAPSEDLVTADWQRALAMNLTAPFICAQTAARHMFAEQSGVIVNVSSIVGHIGLPQRAAYATAKSGLHGMTRVLAIEWAQRGVRVLSVDPAYVATDLIMAAQQNSSAPYSDADLIRRTPVGRLAAPDEVAGVVAFAVSADASYMTGSSLVVDGGWLANGSW